MIVSAIDNLTIPEPIPPLNEEIKDVLMVNVEAGLETTYQTPPNYYE
jgi:hypothetical protein